ILPNARLEQGTGAWRVSSRDLGRQLQEDLSIAPNGIVDFGVADMGDSRDGKRTPIDLMIEFGGQRTAAEAALWLWGRLGGAPAALGWQDKRSDAFAALARGEQKAGDAGSGAGAQPSQEQAPLPRLLVSSKTFVAGFVSPNYAIDGLVQHRYLYSLTANTGHG